MTCIEKKQTSMKRKECEKNMAAIAVTADMTIQKNSEIIVKVEEALADLIVVSYSTEDKKFQGVLLDSNKGNLPFGVYSLHPAFSKEKTSLDKDDKLHSVSQRFLYQEPGYDSKSQQIPKRGPKAKTQQKMTVRLRPRKVLCSNCKGICNENSENVDVKKRKHSTLNEDDSQDRFQDDGMNKKMLMGSMLIPKLSRLHPDEITDAIKGTKKCDKSDSNKASERTRNMEDISCDNDRVPDLAFVNVAEDINMNCDTLDDNIQQTDNNGLTSIFSSAKTIKICFGEGEGTVVKIPHVIGDFNEDSGVCDMSKQSEIKAAKKALKKAKKLAKKITSTSNLPQKHVGALSPRNTDDALPNMDDKKHKYKIKHKKKNKIAKERDENTSKGEIETVNYFSNIKQKVCISLKKVDDSNSYQKCDDEESESEDWESDTVPDFPETGSEGIGQRHMRVSVGDIVWGKVGGFPWWPGRVLSVTPTSRAHVAWFASTTSSLMPCDSLSPFLEDYKLRFNKKKRGPYKEAVKQATIEAKRLEEHEIDPLSSPTHLVTMSPRAINVFS